MNEPTLILDEGGMPILEQCEGVTMPADYSFKCINNYVHCESPQYEDLQHLALGMSSHIEALRKENEQLRSGLLKWQPIEKAPKDILVDIFSGERRYASCHYDRICNEWRHITACGIMIRLKNPSHWMPLPESPNMKGGAA